jgi:DNA-binding CsgD family transcriptional regulator
MDGWRLHLLLSDDDPAIGALLDRVVSAGHRRKVAGDGRAALEALDRLPNDGPVLVAMEPQTHQHHSTPARNLTPQERRTLQLSADGASIAEVAAELYISATTVKTHLRHAADKLGVRGRSAAVAQALRRGLIV